VRGAVSNDRPYRASGASVRKSLGLKRKLVEEAGDWLRLLRPYVNYQFSVRTWTKEPYYCHEPKFSPNLTAADAAGSLGRNVHDKYYVVLSSPASLRGRLAGLAYALVATLR
jgi:hypothetical protein